MEGYILGLDLGPSSIGWAAVDVDKQGNSKQFVKLKDGEKSLLALNSRIFPSGVENLGQGQKEETRNKKRRESRGIRRTLRRRRARKLKLIRVLRNSKILPDDSWSLGLVQAMDPYEIRNRALKEHVSLYEIGSLLLHFTKRRGFKSNRKDFNKDPKAGEVNKARTNFEKALGSSTPGQFWYEQRKKNCREPIRNRISQYKWIAERDQYEDELGRIWKVQHIAYPDILTKELHDKVSEILFRQIPYEISNTKKRDVIGYCSLIKGKLRCDYSNRLAQEFRLLQKLNDLEIRRKGEKIEIDPDKRMILYNKLMVTKEVKFKDARKILGIEEIDKINFEFEGNDSLIGNEIDYQLTKRGFIDKKKWLSLDDVYKDQIWQEVLYYFNDEKVNIQKTINVIQKISGQRLENPESINNISIPTKTVKYSKEALERIIPHMRKGLDLYQAISKSGFAKKYKTLKKLPLPDKSNSYQISNPNVKVVLFELRKLINRLIDEFGKPQKIIIEFTRDIKASKEVRQKILKQQAERRKLKERIVGELKYLPDWKECEYIPAWAIEKYILWHEQKFICPYSGKIIELDQLFTRDIEVDHILPYSISLDNSLNNKVVCFAKENQDKGQRTPFEWISHDEKRWIIVLGTIDHFNPQRKTRGKRPTVRATMDMKELAAKNKDKWQRFFMTNDQIEEIYWQPRFLPESGYIAREVRDYLKSLYPYKIADQKVVTTKGGITYELRKWWDLNKILGDGDQKERSDLRHHALDAAVIACTNPKIIKNITTEIQKAWPQKRPSEIYVDRPWDGFEDDLAEAISQVNISHRVQRKVKGQLHKESFYRKQTQGKYKGKYTIRKTLDSTFKVSTAKRICDNTTRRLVIQRLNNFNSNPKKAFLEPIYLTDKDGKNASKVARVTIWEDYKDDNMLEIRPNVFVVRPENHHIEIFKRKSASQVEFRCKTWDLWDVNNRIKNKEPITIKRHPEFTDFDFVMSLSKGETVELNGKNGRRTLARVKEIGKDTNEGKSTDLHLWEVQVAKIVGRITQETPNAYRVRSMNDFKNLEIRKVTVDPFGRIRRAND